MNKKDNNNLFKFKKKLNKIEKKLLIFSYFNFKLKPFYQASRSAVGAP